MVKNNKGNTVVYIVIGAVLLVSLVLGIYFYNKSQTRKENIAKLQKLEKELFRTLNKENFASYKDGRISPKNRSEIVDNITLLEKNIKEFDKTLPLVTNSSDEIICSSTRKSAVQIRYIDELNKVFLGTGYESTERNQENWYRSYDDSLQQFKRDYQRTCGDLYEKIGLDSSF